MSSTRRALWHTGVYAAGLVVNRGVAYLLVPVYTRVWAQEQAEFAVWDVSTTTVLILGPIIEVAMAAALQRFYYLFETVENRKQLFNTVFFFLLFACAVMLTLGTAFAAPLAGFLFESDSRRDLVYLVCLITGASVLANLPLTMLRAQQRSVAYSVVNLFRALVAPPLSLFLLLRMGMGTAGVLWGECAGHTAVFVAGMYLCRSFIGFDARFSMLKDLLFFSIPVAIARFGLLIINYSDRYVLKHLIGLEAMAPVSLAFKAAIVITLFTRAIQTGWPASAFELATQDNGRASLAKLVRVLSVIFAGAAVLLTAVSPELVRVLGPPEYHSAKWYVPWIALSYALFGGMLLITTMISISKKTIVLPLLHLTGGCLKIGLAFAMIYAFGGIGAPLSTVGAYLVELGFAYYVAQKLYPIPYDTRKLCLLLVLTLGCMIAMIMCNLLPFYLSVAGRGALLAAFPALLLTTGIMTRGEVSGLFKVIGRRGAWLRGPVRKAEK